MIQTDNKKAQHYDVLIAGGGAAGFFTAINIAEQIKGARIAILERGKESLAKVRISGGGRCNVTHAEFIPRTLSKNYPRGEKELLGPFHSFMTGDIMEWFEQRGVSLKIEEDGRVFPITDSSQTIIDCFQNRMGDLKIPVLFKQVVKKVTKDKAIWVVETSQNIFTCNHMVLATGSNPKVWNMLEIMNHSIVPPVPSLFTFNIKDKRIEGLMGVSTNASVYIENTKLMAQGPLLITHWGLSGPGVLKLSAWGARELHEFNYIFSIRVNWLVYLTVEETIETLELLKEQQAKQSPFKKPHFDLPKRLWHRLLEAAAIVPEKNWADLNKKQIRSLALFLCSSVFQVEGKSTFKEEFVTAGGVNLKEIDFKTFMSKKHENLYFAGEILNIDAITGGFNFQNAWTGGFLIAKSIVSRLL